MQSSSTFVPMIHYLLIHIYMMIKCPIKNIMLDNFLVVRHNFYEIVTQLFIFFIHISFVGQSSKYAVPILLNFFYFSLVIYRNLSFSHLGSSGLASSALCF